MAAVRWGLRLTRLLSVWLLEAIGGLGTLGSLLLDIIIIIGEAIGGLGTLGSLV